MNETEPSPDTSASGNGEARDQVPAEQGVGQSHPADGRTLHDTNRVIDLMEVLKAALDKPPQTTTSHMTTLSPLFPNNQLSQESWDGLNYLLQHGEPYLADKWVVRESALLAIKKLTGPASHGVIGWTRFEKQYSNHIPAHVAQMEAMREWAMRHGVVLLETWIPETEHLPQGGVRFEALYLRDADGKSAPVDATGLLFDGWRLFTGEVFLPLEWTETDAVKTRDDGLEVDAAPTEQSGTVASPDKAGPLPSSPDASSRRLLVVGDEVIAQHTDGELEVTTVARVYLTRDGSGKRVSLFKTDLGDTLFHVEDLLLIERTIEHNDQ